MTDPEVTGQDPSAAPAPWSPPTQWSPPTPQDTVTAQAPAQALPVLAPRRRRRWPWVTLAAVVAVAGLVAGLVVWAPWIPPPVLRPAGVAAGPATATSVSLRWSRPATGPLPDKYLILNNGVVAGSVAGKATSYQQTALTPATGYQMRVVAERGGKRSPQSAALPVRTVTPPISQGRMQGTWVVSVKLTQGPTLSRRHWLYSWVATPACSAGACDTKLRMRGGPHGFSMKLTRTGGVYQGKVTLPDFIKCGTGGSFVWDAASMTFRLRVTAATGESTTWAAISLAGTMVANTQYVSGSVYYCPAATFKATVSGNSPYTS